ncbi:MAG TPA: hypothetical protein VF045_10175 [Acidimicrobiales bacterium]
MAVVTAAGPQAVAQEAAEAPARPGIARFEGSEIDLRAGWGNAQACLVARRAGVVECFRSSAAMEARERQVAANRGAPRTDTMAAASSGWWCESPLRLYEHGFYGGRQLSFWDPGFWQNLGDWGFNDQVSSFRIGSCHAYLAEHSWGGGAWYPGYTGPYVSSPTMSSGWNDRISSIYNG